MPAHSGIPCDPFLIPLKVRSGPPDSYTSATLSGGCIGQSAVNRDCRPGGWCLACSEEEHRVGHMLRCHSSFQQIALLIVVFKTLFAETPGPHPVRPHFRP